MPDIQLPADTTAIMRIFLNATMPHPAIQNEDIRRRIRVSLAIDLIIAILNSLAIVIMFFAFDRQERSFLMYLLPSLFSVGIALSGYSLTRRENYVPGIILTIIAVAINSFGAILVTPGTEAFNYTVLVVGLPLVASLFLSVRRVALTIVWTILILGVIFTFHYDFAIIFFDEVYELDGFARFIGLVNVSGVSFVILVSMRLRDMLEVDRLEAQEKAISERLRAESYKRADEVKSTFLASMSHELRTPLNAIINFTAFVADGDLGPVNQEQQEYLNNVVTSAHHLLTLINDVLDMSKIEAGSLELYVIPNVDIRVVIRDLLPVARILLEDKPVTLHFQPADELPPVNVDRQRITQVLLNLIANACKFTDTGSITIAAYQDASDIIISVTDTGSGISKEDQEVIFIPFRQAKGGIQRGGTGLGLPIARKLIEAHGGRIWIDSTEDEGATFYVAIPLQVSGSEQHIAGDNTNV